MPRQVDHRQRRKDITAAAVRILSRGPTSQLTLRSLAEELGGSITLVTHFFANRDDLFVAIVDDLIAGYDAEIAKLEEGEDEVERLRTLLRWMVPSKRSDIERECGRVALIAHRAEHQHVQYFFDSMERRMRGLLQSHLRPLVPREELNASVDFLRATVNGIVLSAVEHPQRWPRARQFKTIDLALRGLGIEPTSSQASA